MTTVKTALITGLHPNSFKCGQAATIVGLNWVTPDGRTPRLCYLALFGDGSTDLICISDAHNCDLYKISASS